MPNQYVDDERGVMIENADTHKSKQQEYRREEYKTRLFTSAYVNANGSFVTMPIWEYNYLAKKVKLGQEMHEIRRKCMKKKGKWEFKF